MLRNSFAPEAFHTLFKSLTLGSPTELWDGHSYLRTKFYLKDFQRRILFLNRIQTRHTFYSKTYFLGNFTFAEGLGATSAGSTLPPTLWVPPTSVENFRKLPVLSCHPLNNSRTHASLSLFCLWRNWATEKLWTKACKHVSDRILLSPHDIVPWASCFFPSPWLCPFYTFLSPYPYLSPDAQSLQQLLS